jgi:site-specific DNA recombinase
MFSGIHEPLVTKDLFDKVQRVMKRRSKPSTVRLKTYVYRGLFHCGECGCGITMETQKGHNYLRCTKRMKKSCSQHYVREEATTSQIASVLLSVSLPDDRADWLIERLESDRKQNGRLLQEQKRTVEKKIQTIDLKLDRLTAAYLDAGAFNAAEFRKCKEESINQKRKLHWFPRGAWKLVVDQGYFAQHNAAPKISSAAFIGKTRLCPTSSSGRSRTCSPRFRRSVLT